MNKVFNCQVSSGITYCSATSKEKTVEIHIFDKDLDLYGENLTVLWLDKIREMIKFDSIEALIVQMKDDEEKARQYKVKEA